MQKLFDFTTIIREAWHEYDPSQCIKSIADISAKVSTNYVYRVKLEDDSLVIAKLSYFGRYEHFVEDHTIINALANNLPDPFENFVAKSLTKHGELFTYRYQNSLLDAWVVFYNPIKIDQKPPKRLNEAQIGILGEELAKFHKACKKVRNTLPRNFKQAKDDLDQLVEILDTAPGRFEYRGQRDTILQQCELLYENSDKLKAQNFDTIPVFIDWNIGNFSVTKDFRFYSRWDYDWFRMSSRVMDFYFFSRVTSDIGDRTIFSYLIDPLMEDRFLIFLKAYHAVYPLSKDEVLFMKEAYRFFILNYVVKDGRYFFHELYSSRLRQEAFEIYFPSLDKTFDADKICRALNL